MDNRKVPMDSSGTSILDAYCLLYEIPVKHMKLLEYKYVLTSTG